MAVKIERERVIERILMHLRALKDPSDLPQHAADLHRYTDNNTIIYTNSCNNIGSTNTYMPTSAK